MDQCCKMIFAVGIIILCFMLWSDYSHAQYLPHRQTGLSGSACMRSVATGLKNVEKIATSAKRSMYAGLGRAVQKDDSVMSPPASVQYHMGTDEAWLNTNTPDAPAGTQHGEMLDKAFVWDVPCDSGEEVQSKFDQVKVDKDQVKSKASIRPFGLDTSSENPTYFRKTGMKSFMHQLHVRGGCTGDGPKDGYFNPEACPGFNQSEAHWQAAAAALKPQQATAPTA